MIELKKRKFSTFIKRLQVVFVICMFHIFAFAIFDESDFGGIYLLYALVMTLISIIFFIRYNSFLESEFEKGNIYFYRYKPFSFLGNIYSEYSHNFIYSNNQIMQELVATLNQSLIDNFACQLRKINIIDCNNDLVDKDSRDFVLGELEPLVLKSTSLNVLLDFNKIGNVHNITWRIIVNGGKKDMIYRALWFVLLFPIFFIFWIIPLLKGNKAVIPYSMLDPYSSSFNHNDIRVYSNSVNRVILSVMIDTLKNHNIDVSDLLNSSIINIHGGNNQIGGSIINNTFKKVIGR